MAIIKVLIAAFVGTTFMTAFSYLMSEAYRKLFKEPVLLQYVMRLLRLKIGTSGRAILGWLIHYLIGLLFVIAYNYLWLRAGVEINVWSALIFGAISGVVGIIGWMIIFRLPSDEPRVDYPKYYLQLFFAHIIFGLSVFAIYEWV